jgi:hypothetical protein
LEDETIRLLSINKQIIVGGDFNSPPDSYNGSWSRNKTRKICSYLQEFFMFDAIICKTKEFTFPSDQSIRDCNNSHLNYFLTINFNTFSSHLFHDLQSDHFAVALKLNLNIPKSKPSFTFSKRIINTEEMSDSKWLEFKNSNIPYPELLTKFTQTWRTLLEISKRSQKNLLSGKLSQTLLHQATLRWTNESQRKTLQK